MRSFRLRLIGLCLVVLAPVANAQNIRSFVSGKGLDTNPCTLSAPCRSFAQAIAQTNAGGEIAVLDTAGYGPVTITKSINIINQDGVEAGIAVNSAGDGITIQAGTGDAVNLRGLTITGAGVGRNGISFQSGGVLTVRNSVIRNFTQSGLSVTTGAASVLVSDVIVSDVVGNGIDFSPKASANLVVQRAQISGCSNIGLLLGGSTAPTSAVVSGTVSDTLLTRNLRGIFLDGFSNTAQPIAYIIGSAIVSNTNIGLVASTSRVYLSHSTLAGNKSYGYFIQFAGAAINSFGNNNIVDVTNQGSLTPISQH